MFVDYQLSISDYPPSGSRQTNNTAELTAVIKALQLLPRGKIAICTESDYVYLGATGAARRWKARGWVGSSVPVSNEQLWGCLLVELDNPDRVIEWVKLRSRVSIVGNEQANTLANHGRLANLLYLSEGIPNGRAVRVFTTPFSHVYAMMARLRQAVRLHRLTFGTAVRFVAGELGYLVVLALRG